MGKSILITGGARSGKSRIAEGWVAKAPGKPIYIATGQAFDAEMARRIKDHQDRRGPEWTTVAEPLDLLGALERTDGMGARLVDCLTLWLSNLMHEKADWQDAARHLAMALPRQQSPVVIVTNEVGGGIVPENALARAFRDAQGHLNQTVAAAVDEVYLAVAGYPMKVKPNAVDPNLV
ncbi:MAG: bifunctional adenosylcobinamide kinase/adenosylcobinamide-phosphate guanylyltransferase [Paracoccaceae bacterium]|nr:bifunctional adenosylcobinamide kinase/adenosylcobinamide-phosphate guanylyltransferase [Paracoccaceae bacterium]